MPLLRQAENRLVHEPHLPLVRPMGRQVARYVLPEAGGELVFVFTDVGSFTFFLNVQNSQLRAVFPRQRNGVSSSFGGFWRQICGIKDLADLEIKRRICWSAGTDGQNRTRGMLEYGFGHRT